MNHITVKKGSSPSSRYSLPEHGAGFFKIFRHSVKIKSFWKVLKCCSYSLVFQQSQKEMNTKRWNSWNKAGQKSELHTGMLQVFEDCFEVINDFCSPDVLTITQGCYFQQFGNKNKLNINFCYLRLNCPLAYTHDQFVLLCILSSVLAMGSSQTHGIKFHALHHPHCLLG